MEVECHMYVELPTWDKEFNPLFSNFDIDSKSLFIVRNS